MTRILISGASGGIGQSLVPALSHHHLAILSRSTDFDPHKTIFIGDMASKFPYKNIREFDPEIVIHLAGDSTTNINETTIPKIVEANFAYGCQLLNALEHTSCRLFLNMRSATEYSAVEQGGGVLSPAYLFSAVKTAFTHVLDYYQERLDFARVDCILYFVYGADGKKKRVFDYLLESVNSETTIAFSPGEQQLDFIHVSDVCRCIDYLVSEPAVSATNHLLHVGTGEVYSLRDVAALMEELTNTKLNIKWGGLDYRDGDIMFSRAPQNNLNNLDWSPALCLREGLTVLLKSKGLL